MLETCGSGAGVGRAGGRTFPVIELVSQAGRRWNVGREGTPMLKVVQTDQEGQHSATDVRSGSLLGDIAREGARRMLAAALKAESDVVMSHLTASSCLGSVRATQPG